MMDFMMVMSPEQVKKHHQEVLKWVKEVLRGKYSTYIANMLYALKNLCDQIEQEKKR